MQVITQRRCGSNIACYWTYIVYQMGYNCPIYLCSRLRLRKLHLHRRLAGDSDRGRLHGLRRQTGLQPQLLLLQGHLPHHHSLIQLASNGCCSNNGFSLSRRPTHYQSLRGGLELRGTETRDRYHRGRLDG